MAQEQNTTAYNSQAIDHLTQFYLEFVQRRSEIDLSDWRISVNKVKALTATLKSGKCREGLGLNLRNSGIDVKALADALASGNCPKGLVLKLGCNDIGAEGAKQLAAAITSGNCPKGLVLKLGCNDIGAEGAKQLAAAITSGNCPEKLELLVV